MMKPRTLPAYLAGQHRQRKANQSGRDADPRRTIPLNSSTWRKLRDRVLARDPICQECYKRGHFTPAMDVDHISGDPSDNSMCNLQGLCHHCHSKKTARDHGKNVPLGCDLSGWPADPSHPWNATPATATQAAEALDENKSLEADRNRPLPPSSFNAKGKEP